MVRTARFAFDNDCPSRQWPIDPRDDEWDEIDEQPGVASGGRQSPDGEGLHHISDASPIEPTET